MDVDLDVLHEVLERKPNHTSVTESHFGTPKCQKFDPKMSKF